MPAPTVVSRTARRPSSPVAPPASATPSPARWRPAVRPRARRPGRRAARGGRRRPAASGTASGSRCWSADLADRAQLERVAARLRDGDRPVDLLVNNAGFAVKQWFVGGDVAAEEQLLDVLVRAVLVLTHSGPAGDGARGSRRGRHGLVGRRVHARRHLLGGQGLGHDVHRCPSPRSSTAPASPRPRSAPGTCTPSSTAGPASGGAAARLVWLDADRLVAGCLADVARGPLDQHPGLAVPRRRRRPAAPAAAPRPVVRPRPHAPPPPLSARPAAPGRLRSGSGAPPGWAPCSPGSHWVTLRHAMSTESNRGRE